MIESDRTEFKRELNDKLEREVVAFLNAKTGGDIYIGIDNEGKAVGINDSDTIQLEITSRIQNNILPSCLGLFDVYPENKDQRTIIHIAISAGQEKPYYIKKYGMSPSGCYLRVGSGVKQMDVAMISQLFASRTRTSLRNIASPRYAEHTFTQLKIYYEEKGYKLNHAFLHNLDLYTPDGKFNYVAYLLADTNSVSFKVAKFAGFDKSKLIENEEYGLCSIIKATQKLMDKLDIENKTFTSVSQSAQRLERRMINPEALREALINAIVHNDYSRDVSPVIEIYSDRLCIISFGGLVNDLSQADFFKGRSIPRNRELMRIFRDLNFVEHLGIGMEKILNTYDKSIFNISDNFLEVCFPYTPDYMNLSNQNTIDKKEQVGEQVREQVGEQVIKLIIIIDGERSLTELMTSLNLKGRRNFIEKYLSPALLSGYIELTQPNSPKSPTQKYRLSKKGLTMRNNFKIN